LFVSGPHIGPVQKLADEGLPGHEPTILVVFR
jgi:hypothetical protein